jgi:rubrerythrin
MKRSFQSLSPQEALHVAIFIEERNAQIYHRFAEMFASFQDLASLEIAGVLWDMAVEERHHSSMLQQRYTARYAQGSCALTDSDIAEVIELPQMEGAELLEANDNSSGGVRHALEIALKAEVSARQYYMELAAITLDSELQALYSELAGMEETHVQFLENKIARRAQSKSGED